MSDSFVDLLTFARTTPEDSQNMNQTKFKMMMVSFLLINNYEGNKNDNDKNHNDKNDNDCLMTSLVVSVRSVSPWHGNEVVQVLSPHF